MSYKEEAKRAEELILKGQKEIYINRGSNSRNMRGWYYIRETKAAYYIQSYDTIVACVSKKTGKVYNTWGGYSRSTMVHINWALEWIASNTKTRPEKRKMSGEDYYNAPRKTGINHIRFVWA